MEKSRYEELKKISLEKSGIIKCDISDPIYKFCMLNKIDNLGDFIENYNKKRTTMDFRHNFYYFDGVIDLINLIWFGDKLVEDKNLSKKIKIFNNKQSITRYAYVSENAGAQIGCIKNKALRRLGFNNEETKSILGHVLYLNKEVTIITAIKSCIANFNFKKIDADDEMFITKLYILSQYYENCKDNIECVDSYELCKVKEELTELRRLYRQMYKTHSRIVELSCDFERNIEKLPEDNEVVKKLINEYQSFNCK